MGKGIAVFGTSSGVGKTLIAAAICRYFSETGKRVFPFKAFNLSSNAFYSEGMRVGWAQYIQSESCNRPYEASMNPVFCDYSTGHKRFFINGKETDLYGTDELTFMRETAAAAFEQALAGNDLVVVEGSGSCCELNLANSDVANMYFAQRNNLPVILVSSIADGGVFGSLYGTLALLSTEARRLVKGLIVNKFFGNIESFSDGRAIIERTCGVDVLSVMPHITLDLPQEDRGPQKLHEDIDKSALRNELDRLAKTFHTHTDLMMLERIAEEGVAL